MRTTGVTSFVSVVLPPTVVPPPAECQASSPVVPPPAARLSVLVRGTIGVTSFVSVVEVVPPTVVPLPAQASSLVVPPPGACQFWYRDVGQGCHLALPTRATVFGVVVGKGEVRFSVFSESSCPESPTTPNTSPSTRSESDVFGVVGGKGATFVLHANWEDVGLRGRNCKEKVHGRLVMCQNYWFLSCAAHHHPITCEHQVVYVMLFLQGCRCCPAPVIACWCHSHTRPEIQDFGNTISPLPVCL